MTTDARPPENGDTQEINGLKFVRSMGHWLPAAGSWPCQHAADPKAPEALVAFLYRCLRDGAAAPSDIENHAIQAAAGGQDPVAYTNPHLEAYARSLAGLFLRPKLEDMTTAAENRVDQLKRPLVVYYRRGDAMGVPTMQAIQDADVAIEINTVGETVKLTKDRHGEFDFQVVD